MANLQSCAERDFYDGIGLITIDEKPEMGIGPDIYFLKLDDVGRRNYRPFYSINRIERLKNLTEAYQTEIENNLSIEGVDKAILIDRHLKKAANFRNTYIKDYDRYLSANNIDHFNLSGTDQQIWLLNNLIIKLKDQLKQQPEDAKNDIQYSLFELFDEKLESTTTFKNIKSQIERKGFLRIMDKDESVKVYSAHLALVLTSSELLLHEAFNSYPLHPPHLAYKKIAKHLC